jgi:hypothetical protein
LPAASGMQCDLPRNQHTVKGKPLICAGDGQGIFHVLCKNHNFAQMKCPHDGSALS